MSSTIKEIENASKLLDDTDPRNRLKAIRELTKIALRFEVADDRKRIVDLLAKAAGDKEPFVVWNLAISLGQIAHPSAIPILEGMVEHPHANVRLRVALALGLIGHEDGISVLDRMSQDKYKIGQSTAVVRESVALALGKIGSEHCVPVLAKLVNDEDPAVRWHTAVALGDVGHSSGISHLAKLIEDEVPFVRGHVAIALAQIGSKEGLQYLIRTKEFTEKHAEQTGSEAEKRMAKVCVDALNTLKSIMGENR
jgi:HEAT repeat protein